MVVHAPRVEFAKKGANPTLKTIELIRGALRQAGGPVSRNSLLENLARWGHATSRQSLNAALGFLMEDGLVVDGSKGLQWISEAEGDIFDTILRKRSH